MDWARILTYVTGAVDQDLLARNEYQTTENRILKDQLKGRVMLSDAERATLGEIGHRLGRKVLAEVATVARPDTIPQTGQPVNINQDGLFRLPDPERPCSTNSRPCAPCSRGLELDTTFRFYQSVVVLFRACRISNCE
jgi:hypothetical protein